MTQRPSRIIRSSELRAARGKPRLALRGELDGLRADNVAQENYLTRVRPLTATVDQILAVQTANTASFSVHKNGTAQAVATGTETQITFGTEVFDVGSCFSSNAADAMPAGTVLLICQVSLSSIPTGGPPSTVTVRIKKDSTTIAEYKTTNQNDAEVAVLIVIAQSDGTNVFRVYADGNGGATSYTIDGGASETWFQGSMI